MLTYYTFTFQPNSAHPPSPSFMTLEQASPQAARTARTALRSLCSGAGAARSTSGVQPDACSVLGWVAAPLPQALHSASYTAHISGSGSSSVTRMQAKLWLQTWTMTLSSVDTGYSQKETSLPCLPGFQGELLILMYVMAEKPMMCCLLLNFAFLFRDPQCCITLHIKLCVPVCIYTIIHGFQKEQFCGAYSTWNPWAHRQQPQYNPDNICPVRGSILF